MDATLKHTSVNAGLGFAVSPHHDLQREDSEHVAEFASQVSDMTADNSTVTFSRGTAREEEGWTDSDDDSSATTNNTHGITQRSRAPFGPPSVHSSVFVSRSLPRTLAATISTIEPRLAPRSKSAHRLQSPPESRSPSEHTRRFKTPPPPPPPRPPSLPQTRLVSIARASPFETHSPTPDPTRPSSRFSEAVWAQTSTYDPTWKLAVVKRGLEISEDDSTDELPGLGYEQDDFEYGSLGDVDEDEDHEYSDQPGKGNLQRLADQYAKLRHRRAVLGDVFASIRSKRTQVQDLRHRKDEADRAFMAAVQAVLPHTQALDRLFRTMQTNLLQCQEAEQRFDDMIDDLQNGEAELESEETKFLIAAGATSIALGDETDDDSCSQATGDIALRGITGDRPQVFHPLFEQLRETVRDLQLAKELLANTKMKKMAFGARKSQTLSEDSLDLLQTYGGAGKKRALELRRSELMTEEDLEELQEYHDLEQKAIADVGVFTDRAQYLESKCLEQGVMPEDSPFRQGGFGCDPTSRDEISLGAEPSDSIHSRGYPKTLAHPVFPSLLSNPTHLLESFPQTPTESLRMAVSLPSTLPTREQHIDDAAREVNIHLLLSETRTGDKSDYINRWLLHKLHFSAMEAELLWCTFRSRLKILDIDRWQQDVLHFWWRDQAANLPPALFENIYAGRSSASVDPKNDHPSRTYSDSGQLDGLKHWDIEEAWP
ncbi:Uu.00g091290.m01.CDS01 [Anthostomella pinea]|uniref:Uu.00g091290.m01.CDS01 n=1 Tax=Anthostomella pinea TaxID=933095 RepID=A0AAI8VHL4_9PEZI|nr:Uu.00g091290.m01.CDS01 [Anthostomella pinea]